MDKTFDEFFREVGGQEEEKKLDTGNRLELVTKGKKVYLHVYKNNKLVEVTRTR